MSAGRLYQLLIIISVFATVLSVSCKQSTFTQGKVLYETHCSSCHMNDGSGLSLLYPSLQNSERMNKIVELIPCMIVEGIPPNDTIPNSGMIAFPKLTNVEISNIINYMFTNLNNGLEPIDIKMINTYLEPCKNY